MFCGEMKTTGDFVACFVRWLIVVLIATLLIRFFWNRGLVPHVTVLKPIKSLTDALMVAIGLSLIA